MIATILLVITGAFRHISAQSGSSKDGKALWCRAKHCFTFYLIIRMMVMVLVMTMVMVMTEYSMVAVFNTMHTVKLNQQILISRCIPAIWCPAALAAPKLHNCPFFIGREDIRGILLGTMMGKILRSLLMVVMMMSRQNNDDDAGMSAMLWVEGSSLMWGSYFPDWVAEENTLGW